MATKRDARQKIGGSKSSMSASDRECNSEGERLHNTRQRAAELRGRSENEQSQGEECDRGEESCPERGDGTDDEAGRASLGQARAADEDTEDYADGIGSLYVTAEEERARTMLRDCGLERTNEDEAHRHPISTDQMGEAREDHSADRHHVDDSNQSHTQHEARGERHHPGGLGSCPTPSTDATLRQQERVSREPERVKGTTEGRPSALQQTVQRLTEGNGSRNPGKRGRPTRQNRGSRRLSPLALEHQGQQFSVAQPFKPRDQKARGASRQENSPRRETPPAGFQELTEKKKRDWEQHGLQRANDFTTEGVRHAREARTARKAESPAGRGKIESRQILPPISKQEQDARDQYGLHMAHQLALAGCDRRHDSTADEETDDDVWYDTGDQQLNGVPIDWDEKRQEPIGPFDLAYCSIARAEYEHELSQIMLAKERRMTGESRHRRRSEARSGQVSLQDRGVHTAVRPRVPVKKEVACATQVETKRIKTTRMPDSVGKGRDQGRWMSAEEWSEAEGIAQGETLRAPEGFARGLERALRREKEGANGKATDTFMIKEQENSKELVRQLLTRMNEREDDLQDQKDWGATRQRHTAGDRGAGDAGKRRAVPRLSEADVAWFNRTYDSSLKRLQEGCIRRLTSEERKTESKMHGQPEETSSRAKGESAASSALTTDLIEYIEAQERKVEQLEEQVRTSRQSSPRRERREGSYNLEGARRYLQAKVDTERATSRYADELAQEVTGKPRRAMRLREQLGTRESSDNSYGRPVEREAKKQFKKKSPSLETRAARRKREFLAQVAAFEAESTGEETGAEEVAIAAPVIQMRTSGPVTKVKPPSFDGTMFLAFEQQFEAACRCSGYDEAARVELLRCSLRGQARQLLLNSGADSWTYAQLMEALRTRHGKTRSKTEIRNALRGMYKKPGQKALDFADEVDFVASQAEFTPKELTTATYEAFWHGLRTTPRQQKYVEKHDTTQTLKMAAEIAARWERTKGTTEDAYVPEATQPIDWAIIQARQAVNTGAPISGVHMQTNLGQGQMIASAMSNEALLRQEEKDRETKKKEQVATAPAVGRTLAELQATLDDLSSDHAVLKSSIIRERHQRNMNRGRGGYRGRGGGGTGSRRPPYQPNYDPNFQQGGNQAPQDSRIGHDQA